MRVKFNEKKATQIAALVLKARDGKMDLFDLMKIVYCIDRAALLKLRWPLTGDRYAALPKGMVLSRTYDLAKDEGWCFPTFWDQHIHRADGFFVSLTEDPGRDELSNQELELINSVLKELESASWKDLLDFHHGKLPEWEDPKGSSFTVMYETVLEKEGWQEGQIQSLSDQVEIHSEFECAI